MPAAETFVRRIGEYRDRLALVALAVAGLATVTFIAWPQLVGVVGVLASWLGTLLITLLTHWNASERLFGRLLSNLAWADSRVERVALAADMEGTINGARAELSAELADIMVHPVRVEFVRDQTDLARLSDGDIVVSLNNPKQHAENLAVATLAYVSSSTIRPARQYIEPAVMTAVDFSITKRILRAADGHALDHFFDTLWNPAVHDEPELRELCHQVETIEREGVLSRVLLAEYLELGRRLFGTFPQADSFEATKQFLHRLYRIVTKGDNEELDDDLYFAVGPMSIGIVLVADSVRAQQGARPYLWRCRDDMRRGCQAVYLLARGRRNIALLQEVLGRLDGDGRVVAIDTSEYSVPSRIGPIRVVCARVVADGAAGVTAGRSGRKRHRRHREAEGERAAAS